MRFKKTLSAVAVIGLLAIISKTVDNYYANQVYQGYIANQATAYIEIDRSSRDSYDFQRFMFDAIDGNQVSVSAAFPKGESGPFATVIMLYGIGQEMTFLSDIAELFTRQGFAIYMMEQYQRGERRADDINAVSEFLGMRKRATLNMLETRRLVDTLAGRSEVDNNQLYFWGISFGTMTGVPTFSEEPRFKAAIFSIGGGDVFEILTTSQTYKDSNLSGKLASIALGYYMAAAEPLPYAKKLSGRPILFQNALQDQLIPINNAEALHRMAGEPKKVIWYDTDHEGKLNNQAMNYFIDGLTWLKQIHRSQ